MKEETLKTSKGAYPGCLFLMMANNRYEPVKKILHKAFIVEKQQHPRNILVMKRFMANCSSAAASKPTRQQQQQV